MIEKDREIETWFRTYGSVKKMTMSRIERDKELGAIVLHMPRNREVHNTYM